MLEIRQAKGSCTDCGCERVTVMVLAFLLGILATITAEFAIIYLMATIHGEDDRDGETRDFTDN